MNFVKSFIGTSKVAPKLALPVADGIPRLSFRHSATRWHGDSRPETPVVLVHDLMASADVWTPFVRAAGQLPTQVSPASDQDALSVKSPVDWFAVDLPFHGPSTSSVPIPQVVADKFLEFSAERIVDFIAAQTDHNQSVGKVHLVGSGAGAYVCALAALALQDGVASVTLLNPKVGLGEASLARRELLKKAVSEPGATLASVDAFLKQSVPNAAERTQLLHNVVRVPGSPSLALRSAATYDWKDDLVSHSPLGTPLCESVFHGTATLFSATAVSQGFQSVFPSLKHIQHTIQFNGDGNDVKVAVELVEALGLLGTVPIGAPTEESSDAAQG